MHIMKESDRVTVVCNYKKLEEDSVLGRCEPNIRKYILTRIRRIKSLGDRPDNTFIFIAVLIEIIKIWLT